MNKKLVFNGCSFTAGTGWLESDPLSEVKEHPNLWVNLVAKQIVDFENLELINLAQGGSSNTEIFRRTVAIMAELGSDIDTLFCQWTSMFRYNFHIGFELWNTSESLVTDALDHDVYLNRGNHYTREYIRDLLNRFRALHHLHWEILQVVEFTNTIRKLAQRIGMRRLFFINGLCPWDRDYFVRLDGVLPEAYTEFTKKDILNINSRDDKDIHALYNLAHRHYEQAGGIDPADWVNLYDSFLHLRSDRNFDGRHPGIHSNQLYFQLVQKKLLS